MSQPPKFDIPSNTPMACKLHKALQGLKQASRTWFDRLNEILCKLSFLSSKVDKYLFLKITPKSSLYILVYVDDIIITQSSESEVEKLIQLLNKAFSLKYLGELDYFQGIKVTKSVDGLLLTQRKYILDLLKKVQMENANSFLTPMITGQRLTAHEGDPFDDGKLYRSIVKGLQHATITKPETAYSVNKVSQFIQSPLNSYWKAVKRILCYLKGTITYGLKLSRSNQLNLVGVGNSILKA